MEHKTSKDSPLIPANLPESAASLCPSMEAFFTSHGITSEEEKSAFVQYMKELFSITIDYLALKENDKL